MGACTSEALESLGKALIVVLNVLVLIRPGDGDSALRCCSVESARGITRCSADREKYVCAVQIPVGPGTSHFKAI